MAAVCQPRRALVEIPAPQPKIAARMRRSYLEILSARLAPSPLPRGRTTAPKRVQSLDLSIGGVWRGGMEEHCEKMDEPHTPLSKQQLVQLIRSLILVEQSQEPRIIASDLKYLQEDLQLKKANVYRSIPYSRFGSNRDAHCYRKAYPHLVAFKVSCQEWGQVLLRNKEWDAALEHSLMAWRYTSELPQWDTANHNALREQCYSILAAHSLTALEHYRPEPNRGRELLRSFLTDGLATSCKAAWTSYWSPVFPPVESKLRCVYRLGWYTSPSKASGITFLLKMAQLHSQSIVPCIQELQRIMGCCDDSSVDTK